MRVTYRRELKIKSVLDELGVENFLPMHYQITGKDDQSKYELVPAIHNLIFVRSTQEHITQLKMTQRNLEPMRYMMKTSVSGLGGAEIMRVPDRQMENFIRVAKADSDKVIFLKYSKYLAKPGQRVRVVEGYLAGVEGVIKRIKNNKHVVVQIDGVAAVAIAYVPKQNLLVL